MCEINLHGGDFMSNEHVTEQQEAEGFAYIRALLSRREDQPKPDAPDWIEEATRKDEAEKEEKAAESARAPVKTAAEIFGKVKATGPFTAADARVGLDDRGEAQIKDPEDYEND